MSTLNQADLKYFSGCALTGLLSNPQYSTINGQKYLQMKKLTLEALAVQSALEMMEVLNRLADELDKVEAEKVVQISGGTDGSNK